MMEIEETKDKGLIIRIPPSECERIYDLAKRGIKYNPNAKPDKNGVVDPYGKEIGLVYCDDGQLAVNRGDGKTAPATVVLRVGLPRGHVPAEIRKTVQKITVGKGNAASWE